VEHEVGKGMVAGRKKKAGLKTVHCLHVVWKSKGRKLHSVPSENLSRTDAESCCGRTITGPEGVMVLLSLFTKERTPSTQSGNPVCGFTRMTVNVQLKAWTGKVAQRMLSFTFVL